jgi:hypothetical protein
MGLRRERTIAAKPLTRRDDVAFHDGESELDLAELVHPGILSTPKVFEEYALVATGDPDPPSRPARFSSYDGATAYLRVVLAGSPIPEWVKPLALDDVVLAPCKGPVWVQRTYVTRPETADVDYEKVHQRVETGHGRHLTIGLSRFTLDTTNLSRLMTTSSRKVMSAAGILAALTDERFAVEVLAENVLILKEKEVVHVVDMTPGVRHYDRDRGLNQVRLLPCCGDDVFSDVERSARWYLKGAQEGPTPEGIVWLCTAIECLVDPPMGKRKKTFNRVALEQAVRAAGDDPTRFVPNLGRVAGLRSQVVHYGEEEPEKLREGYYVLEEVSRLLIRSRINESSDWPCAVPNPEPSADLAVNKRYLQGLDWVVPPASA